jgi:hypothetical protein
MSAKAPNEVGRKPRYARDKGEIRDKELLVSSGSGGKLTPLYSYISLRASHSSSSC